jgi:thiamine biosynthesis protein ThiC
MPKEAHKFALFYSMCGPKFCPTATMQRLRGLSRQA